MKYQIAYVDSFDGVEKIVQAIADSLPAAETSIINLSRGAVPEDGEVYIIGFGMKRGVLPLEIMEMLETLSGKTLLFFVLCGADPVAEYRKVVEYKMAPFMPDSYDYRGMKLCPVKVSEETAKAAYQLLREDPDNEYAEKVIQEYEASGTRPNADDLQDICDFVKKNLAL